MISNRTCVTNLIIELFLRTYYSYKHEKLKIPNNDNYDNNIITNHFESINYVYKK